MERSTTGVLLANLGSPDSYQVNDVRSYLQEFLMDGRVIDMPLIMRKILVKGIIVPVRAPASAAKYKSIWTDNGSPLIHISGLVKNKLAELLDLPVALCMRYGNPSPANALDKLLSEHPAMEEVILVPLYPHYAMSSYETAVEHVKQAMALRSPSLRLKVVPPFFKDDRYITALANSIRTHLKNEFDHLLFSYHGIPRRHVIKTDCTNQHCFSSEDCCSVPSPAHAFCYRHQAIETTHRVAAKLDLPVDKFSFSFQSRLGRDAWLLPYTVAQLKKFPKQGIRKLVVVCPAFVSDCLETVQEIQMEGRDDFMKSGGESFELVPCLNDREDWISALAHLVRRQSEFQPAFG